MSVTFCDQNAQHKLKLYEKGEQLGLVAKDEDVLCAKLSALQEMVTRDQVRS